MIQQSLYFKVENWKVFTVKKLADEPLPGGSLIRFFTEISKLQKREIVKNQDNLNTNLELELQLLLQEMLQPMKG